MAPPQIFVSNIRNYRNGGKNANFVVIDSGFVVRKEKFSPIMNQHKTYLGLVGKRTYDRKKTTVSEK